MAEYPRTVVEFRDWFADEAACRDYLVRLRWPEGFCCPVCGASLPGVQSADLRDGGDLVRRDDWKGYSGLDRLGYRHQIVRSSAEVGENLLPLASRVTSLLKRWLLGTHQGAVTVAHIDYYLDE